MSRSPRNLERATRLTDVSCPAARSEETNAELRGDNRFEPARSVNRTDESLSIAGMPG